MLYAFFFVVSLAIVAAVIGVSLSASHEAQRLERAVELASDAAARFTVDPAAEQNLVSQEGLRSVCEVDDELKPFGRLYHATIRVYDGAAVVYTLEASRYVSERGSDR